MSTARTYTIRGFDVSQPFNCQGVLKDLPTYVEITDVPTEAKAVELLLTHREVSKMVTGVPPITSQSFVDVVNVKAEVNVTDTASAKRVRKAMAETIKTWAEKSRVFGVRGWRAHAIKTPTIHRAKNGQGYELDFDAILGHAIFYTDRTMSVGHTDDASFLESTLADLKKQLARNHPGLIGTISYTHEAAGLAGPV